MDEQVVELIRDQIKQGFEHSNQKIGDLCDIMRSHVDKDLEYWKKIDEQQAQIRLVKSIGGSGLFISAVAWLWQKFGH